MTPTAALMLSEVFCLHRSGAGDTAALQGVDLELGPRERVCVIGPSGAGKTTLLRLCAGLQAPSAGRVSVFGCDLWRVSGVRRAQLRRTHLGILDQHAERALAPDLTAAQAIALPLALRGADRRTSRARAAELLAACGLTDRAEARPHELSGGERQRIALCAALAHRPRLLLADEPTAELDAVAAAELAVLIDELACDHGAAVLLVSHDPALATAIPRNVRLRDGRLASERRDGTPALAVDRSGWIRLPGSLRGSAGIGGWAEARAAGSEIVLRATGAPPGVVTPEPMPPITGPRRPVPVAVLAVSRVRGDGHSRRAVLHELTASFAPGRLTAVVGPSGAGKSTLLELIAGLQRPDAGQVRVAGAELAALGVEQRAALRRESIGYLRQEPVPVGHLSAVENVRLAVALHGRAVTQAAARELLGGLGLGTRSGERVARLSAGEAQRVALAMAIASADGVVVADEPTSRLDRASAGRAIRVLGACAAAGHTVICATHDPEVVSAADAIVELRHVQRAGRRKVDNARVRPSPTPEISVSTSDTAGLVTDLAGLRAHVGEHLGYTPWRELEQSRVNQFADATDDHQFIHVDVEAAKATPFGGTIAHGYLTLSFAAWILEQLMKVTDAKMGVNYGLDKVRFPAPLPVGSEWRGGAELVSVDEIPGGLQGKLKVTVEVKGAKKPSMVAEALVRLYG